MSRVYPKGKPALPQLLGLELPSPSPHRPGRCCSTLGVSLTLLHCFAEEGLLYRARYFGDTDMYHKAQKMGTPSCNRLSEVQASLHG